MTGPGSPGRCALDPELLQALAQDSAFCASSSRVRRRSAPGGGFEERHRGSRKLCPVLANSNGSCQVSFRSCGRPRGRSSASARAAAARARAEARWPAAAARARAPRRRAGPAGRGRGGTPSERATAALRDARRTGSSTGARRRERQEEEQAPDVAQGSSQRAVTGAPEPAAVEVDSAGHPRHAGQETGEPDQTEQGPSPVESHPAVPRAAARRRSPPRRRARAAPDSLRSRPP